MAFSNVLQQQALTRPGSASCGVAGIRRAQLMGRDPSTDEVEEFELAFARLAWAQAAPCLQLPSQRAALDWHRARCDAALAALAAVELHTTAAAGP